MCEAGSQGGFLMKLARKDTRWWSRVLFFFIFWGQKERRVERAQLSDSSAGLISDPALFFFTACDRGVSLTRRLSFSDWASSDWMRPLVKLFINSAVMGLRVVNWWRISSVATWSSTSGVGGGVYGERHWSGVSGTARSGELITVEPSKTESWNCWLSADFLTLALGGVCCSSAEMLLWRDGSRRRSAPSDVGLK